MRSFEEGDPQNRHPVSSGSIAVAAAVTLLAAGCAAAPRNSGDSVRAGREPVCSGVTLKRVSGNIFNVLPKLSRPFRYPGHVLTYLVTEPLNTPSTKPGTLPNIGEGVKNVQRGVGYRGLGIQIAPQEPTLLELVDFGSQSPGKLPASIVSAGVRQVNCPPVDLSKLAAPLLSGSESGA
jgi:hypothetical protein